MRVRTLISDLEFIFLCPSQFNRDLTRNGISKLKNVPHFDPPPVSISLP